MLAMVLCLSACLSVWLCVSVELCLQHDCVARVSWRQLIVVDWVIQKIMGEWRFYETECIVRMKYVHSATSVRNGLSLYKNIVLCTPRRWQCNNWEIWLTVGSTCCLCTVGQLVHTLPEGEQVDGVTLLAGEIYLLRRKGRDQVEVYDVTTYRLQRRLTVPNARSFADMTSCEHNRCVYIGGYNGECVHRLDVQGTVTRWAVNDAPGGLSVNAAVSYTHLTLPTIYSV